MALDSEHVVSSAGDVLGQGKSSGDLGQGQWQWHMKTSGFRRNLVLVQ